MTYLTNNSLETDKKKSFYNKRVFGAWIVLFILWPFAALIGALRRFRAPYAKYIVWLFCVYFGWMMVIEYADSERYAFQLSYMYNNWVSLDLLIKQFYNPNNGYTDLYQPLVTWIVSAFTDNPHFLFAVFGGIFGYFYVQNLWIVYQRIDSKLTVGVLLFLFMLAYALSNPIWQISGVRMWTAAQVFVYGILRYYLKEDKKGIFWVVSSVFFHFSFMFPVLIFFIFIFIPSNQLTILTIFFFTTALIKEADFSFIGEKLSFLPQVFQPRLKSYTNEKFIELINEQSHTWREELASLISRGLLYSWILAAWFLRKNWINDMPSVKNLFAFLLFFGGFANLAGHIASGGRFMTIVYMLFYGILIILLTQKKFNDNIKVLNVLSLPFLLFLLIFTIRLGFERMGIFTLIGNPLIAFFIEDKPALIQIIKSVF